jgi:hypothetical protein
MYCTVPTKSLETRERSLCKKQIFAAFPKIGFLTEGIKNVFGSSYSGWLLPELFSDFYSTYQKFGNAREKLM